MSYDMDAIYRLLVAVSGLDGFGPMDHETDDGGCIRENFHDMSDGAEGGMRRGCVYS